ncbi:hypothetical protein SAMN06265365_11594 [Tistlia consotensis]|uniref:Uncharacterized protein n=1 Tax=Tistlia consotensis USBA 355 TaxID=560819 RepID=A0A1Y6CB85_9PROT|nr:hypothetical protein [Tistlia consotensis]SMF45765.1 hypothetical protein SAMN05428998_11639 [Tistlia consotensis USBA 355]SNR79340.1 hypothetical protein SAMN06265365_11594 [Tistlia consotensis]
MPSGSRLRGCRAPEHAGRGSRAGRTNRQAGLAEKYLDPLRAGGSKRYRELLAPFGLDASDPAFRRKGLSVVSGLIDEFEALDEPAGRGKAS